jgi:hypothetical protein
MTTGTRNDDFQGQRRLAHPVFLDLNFSGIAINVQRVLGAWRMSSVLAATSRTKPKYLPDSKSILMVTEALSRGGAERQMIALIHGLLQHGFKVEILELEGVDVGQAGFEDEGARLAVRMRRAREFQPVPRTEAEKINLCDLHNSRLGGHHHQPRRSGRPGDRATAPRRGALLVRLGERYRRKLSSS